MISLFLSFIVSLLLLIISAALLIKFVEKFSSRIKFSPLVIGATLIAFGTSLPETFVAFSSLAQNAPGISMGDIIGSNIGNICLILGLAILIFPVRIGTEKTQRNNIILLISAFYFSLLFFLPEGIRKFAALALPFLYVIFLIAEIFWGEIGRKKEDKKALAKMEHVRGKPFFYLAGIFVFLIGLIFGGIFLVSSAIKIALLLNIDQQVVGLSLVALGTILPEMVTTIICGFRKDWKLMFGNIQGSNIYNISVLGTIMIVFGNGVIAIHTLSLIYMAGASLIIFLLTIKYKGENIPRKYGLFFIFSYLIYLKLIC